MGILIYTNNEILTVSNAKRRVFQTECLEVETRNGAIVADTLFAFPSNSSSQVDLFEKSQTRYEFSSLGVRSCPVASTLSPRRRVEWSRGLICLGARSSIWVDSIRISGIRPLY